MNHTEYFKTIESRFVYLLFSNLVHKEARNRVFTGV